MPNSKFCNKVITIPQYEPTCWFNAILMAILYSQHSRKLLLDDNIFSRKKTKITKILNHILKYQYISNKYAEQYFNIMTPGKILKYLDLIKEFRKSITNNGWFSEFFLSVFIEKACYKTCITLDLYNNNIYVELKKKIRFIDIINNSKYEGVDILDDKISDIDLQNHIIQKLSEPNPDYIFINIGHETSTNAPYTKHLINNSSRINHIINLKNYNIITQGLEEIKDIITFNGDSYILDSCIISNYNQNIIQLGHAIVGITCKNQKYVYNGWIRSTKDPAMLVNRNIKDDDNDENQKLLPCELMKFDWMVDNKDNKFCINTDMCKLDIIKSNNDPNEYTRLCFSFGIYYRTLIYVKQKNITSIDYNIIKSNPTTITLPSETTKSDNIFVIYNSKKDDKQDLYKKLKLKIKNIKNKNDLIQKLKKLKAKEKELEKEIKILKEKIIY